MPITPKESTGPADVVVSDHEPDPLGPPGRTGSVIGLTGHGFRPKGRPTGRNTRGGAEGARAERRKRERMRNVYVGLAAASVLSLAACTSTTTTDTPTSDVVPSVTVENQTLDPANRVVVKKVASPGKGFIVIHADNAGAPGPVLGNSAVGNGDNLDVVVTLSRDATDGERLYAMLHKDDGQPGVYEFDGVNGIDGPVLGQNELPIAPGFTVTVMSGVTPAVTVEDQTADPANQVVVRLAVSDGPGFIVIHEDAMGAPGPVLGNAALSNGNNRDVRVTLSRDAVDGERLYAMLHTDTGMIGTYEFDGMNMLDGPVRDANGDVITPAFTVTVPVAIVPSVTVEDQTVSPLNRVVIAEAVSDGAGFIVIHEQTMAGMIGGVIGNAALSGGTNTDVEVTLSREVIAGETLYAMLHTDTGVIGTYEFDGMNGLDAPVSDANGDVITPPFVVDFAPSVTAMDQSLSATDRVRVPMAISRGAGFVVIHESNGMGSFGGVLGNVALANGTNRDLEIVLSRHARNGETLYAMLHTDTGVIGTYEFDGMNGFDGPVSDAGGMVIAPSFVVSFVPSVTVASQWIDPTNQVLISRVVSDGPGFIVIHEQTMTGMIGGVIGNVSIENGTTSSVTVTLSRAAGQGERLFAMLHTDNGAIGTYEFDGMNGLDGPVRDANGDVITPDFNVSFPDVQVQNQLVGPTTQVVIDSATSNGPGFVVIHEQTMGGMIGPVIGNAPIGTGTSTAVTVTLSRSVRNGETLYAMLHADTGMIGTYEFDGMNGLDGPVRVDGAVVTPSFIASFEPSVTVMDQTAMGARGLMIPEAVSDGPGFIVIHAQTMAGGIGPVIGNAPLVNGTNTNVMVTVDRDLVNGEVVYGMLHTDTGMIGTYEFTGMAGSPDGPVLDGNFVVIAPPFTVTR